MAKIAIDPITRIEGHLRIEAQIDGDKVSDAWSTGTMFRGMELILRGRDPRDAWVFTQRICGVCTTVHSHTSVRAVEDALGITIPLNALLIRNLIQGVQYLHDHVVHFYHLHALDWVDVVSALSADPAATAKLQQSLSNWQFSSATYFKGVQDRIKAFVESGQLGPFANGYWGHPAYKLPPEANLMAVAHYLEALDWQRKIVRVHALLGAKNPHVQTFLVGGMATPIDPNSQNALNADKIAMMKTWLAEARTFVEQVYIPDVIAIASFYKDWAAIGGGLGNYLSYGEFAQDVNYSSFLFPRGIILNKDLSQVLPMDHKKVAEYISHSWYDYKAGDANPLHPWDGETQPHYTGPQPPYDSMVSDGAKYSWLKAPRYDNTPMEVGPLSRMLIAYGAGVTPVKDAVDYVLKALSVGPEALFSTLGRTAARAIESLVTAQAMDGWVDQLTANIKRGDLKAHNGEKWDPATWGKEVRQGFGFVEAPRGALGHWVSIKDGAIQNYQCVVPSTWNGSPRDAQGKRGAWEEATVGTPIADPERPLEILRTVHSFDPCMACSVHITDVTGNETLQVRVK